MGSAFVGGLDRRDGGDQNLPLFEAARSNFTLCLEKSCYEGNVQGFDDIKGPRDGAMTLASDLQCFVRPKSSPGPSHIGSRRHAPTPITFDDIYTILF